MAKINKLRMLHTFPPRPPLVGYWVLVFAGALWWKMSQKKMKEAKMYSYRREIWARYLQGCRTARNIALLLTLLAFFFPEAAAGNFEESGFIALPPAVKASVTTGVTEIRRIGEITESITLYKAHKKKLCAIHEDSSRMDKRHENKTTSDISQRADSESNAYQEIPVTWKKLIPQSWAKYPVGGIGFNPPLQMKVYKPHSVEVAIFPKDIKDYARGELLKAFKRPEFARYTSLSRVGPSMKVELSPVTPNSFEVSPPNAVRVDLAGRPVTKEWSVTPLEPGPGILALRVSLVATNELAGSDWSPEMLVLERRIVVDIDGWVGYYWEKGLRKAQSPRGLTIIALAALITLGTLRTWLVFLFRQGTTLLRKVISILRIG